MRSLISHLGHTIRRLVKSPGFTVTAILILGLGIGANTAIFSLINGVLLKPLPYTHSEQLVQLFQPFRNYNRFPFNYPDFIDYATEQRSFQALAAWAPDQLNLTGNGEPERVDCFYVSGSFFQVLGRPFLVGRPIDSSEDRPDAAAVAVLGERFWRKHFQADRSIIGAEIVLNDRSFRVIGVTPEQGNESTKVDIYVPLRLSPDFASLEANRGGHGFWCIGRLKDGFSLGQAQSDFERINQNLIAQYPGTDKGFGIQLVPYLESVISDYAAALWILETAVGCLLLIAWANVANLLLVRTQARRKEFSIRAALGAGWVRLAAQMLEESLILAVAGAGVGLLLSWSLSGVIRAIAPEGAARFREVGIDGGVLLFTLAITLGTALIAGLIPVLAGSRADPASSLKEEGGGQNAGRGQRRGQALLVAGQVALTAILLIGAGLLSRSFQALQNVPLGFKPDHVLAADIYLTNSRYSDKAASQRFFDSLLNNLRQMPEVADAGTNDDLPFVGDSVQAFGVPGEHYVELNQMPAAETQIVSPGYFRVLEIPLIRGRFFDDRDQTDSEKVVVINQAIAQRFFPNQDPIGKQINRPGREKALSYTIVGVVADIQHNNPESQESRFQAYYASSQSRENYATVVIRTKGDPRSFVPALRKVVSALDSNLPLSNVTTVNALIERSFSARRWSALVVDLLSGVALLLAAVGLYAVLSYTISQRTREIGIRMTLGAGATNISQLVIRGGLSMVGIGLAIGLATALLLVRFVEGSLYGVSPYDPTAILTGLIVLSFTALVACLLPTFRAARIDPITALRE